MREHIRAACIRLDKPEAFRVVEPLHCACLFHRRLPELMSSGKILVGTKAARQSGDLDQRPSCSPYRGWKPRLRIHLPGGRGAFHGLPGAALPQHPTPFAREANSIE
jgi:hypothetical protein